jgi:GNAT superfamily N-acetyltransferase
VTLHVRLADRRDLETILGFIEEAAAWLPMKDTDQWAVPWPTRARRNGRVKRGLKAQRTWIVEDDGVPVATITCRPDANPGLWTEPEQRDLALYVSRLIVSRSHAGQSVGSELVDWAGLAAARQYGAQWIRIDVWTTNLLLHDYYQKRGFQFLRLCEDSAYPSAALFQKATAEISDADVQRLKEIPALRPPTAWKRESSLASPSPGPRIGARLAGAAARHAAIAGMVMRLPRIVLTLCRRGSAKRY